MRALPLFAILFVSLSACSEERSGDRNAAEYFGNYCATNIFAFGGHLQEKSAFINSIQSPVLISSLNFRNGNLNINNPHYIKNQISINPEEGNINYREYSIFYGFESDRDQLITLEVYSSENTELYDVVFEVLDGPRLIELYDGWVIVYSEIQTDSQCPSPTEGKLF